jgi:hypothetical protein
VSARQSECNQSLQLAPHPTIFPNPDNLAAPPSTMCMIPAIPTEIHDMIVDHLHSDKYALAACALASRDWLPSSRYHLFHSISLGPSSSKRFLSLLRSPCCTILPFVRALNLEEGLGKYASDDDRWLKSDATGCLKRLSCLRCLQLRNVEWEGLELEAQADLMAMFRGITDLEMYGANFESFGRIFGDSPYAFAKLQRLVIVVVVLTHPQFIFHSTAILRQPHAVCNTEPETNKQLTVPEEPSPKIISNQILGDIRSSRTSPIGRLLQDLGPSLRHLQISFGPGSSSHWLYHSITHFL